MNLKSIAWFSDQYENFISELKKMADAKFTEFNRKLISTQYEFIGIRTSLLRGYAKEIAKGHAYDFLNACKKHYYEEILIRGLVIGYLKADFEELIPFIEAYISDIDNWALCDMFCSSLKITKKFKDQVWQYIKGMIKSPNPYRVRFAIVMMLNYYLDPCYIDDVFDIIEGICLDDYTVKMAKAWLVSISYIKFRDKTLSYLNTTNMDAWTYNKSLQKAIESRRTEPWEKDMLRKLKR